MPKSRGREELAVLIALEILAEGIAFDSRDLRRLPFSRSLVTKVLKSLVESGVLKRANARKYLLSEGFLSTGRQEILAKVPRSALMQFPVMTIFDVCGVETWSEHELEEFVARLRRHHRDRSRRGAVTAE